MVSALLKVDWFSFSSSETECWQNVWLFIYRQWKGFGTEKFLLESVAYCVESSRTVGVSCMDLFLPIDLFLVEV